jgi:uncharacterized LabA/DUF88 family protein
MKKAALFVDVQNVYYTVKEAFGCSFDYHAFWKESTAGKDIVCAFAYAIDRHDAKQMQFQDVLRSIGFTVKLKPYIQRSDGTSKGDWDIGIAIDMLEWADRVDSMILVTGDGDFAVLVDKIKEKHRIPITVYGVKKLTSRWLIDAADEFRAIGGDLLLGSPA